MLSRFGVLFFVLPRELPNYFSFPHNWYPWYNLIAIQLQNNSINSTNLTNFSSHQKKKKLCTIIIEGRLQYHLPQYSDLPPNYNSVICILLYFILILEYWMNWLCLLPYYSFISPNLCTSKPLIIVLPQFYYILFILPLLTSLSTSNSLTIRKILVMQANFPKY